MDENAEQQQGDAEGGLGEDGILEECCVLHERRIELAEAPRRQWQNTANLHALTTNRLQHSLYSVFAIKKGVAGTGYQSIFSHVFLCFNPEKPQRGIAVP